MPEMLVLNPRRKARKARKTTKRRTRRKARAHATRTHNPMHKRRVRRSGRRVHARRARRRVHNPRIGGGTLMKGVSIAGGAIVTDVLASKLAAMLPDAWKSNADAVRIGTKAAVGIGLPMLARKLRIIPPGIANAIALGGAVTTALDVFNTYVKPHVPMLSDYEQGTLTGAGDVEQLEAYEPGTLTGGGAYEGSAY